MTTDQNDNAESPAHESEAALIDCVCDSFEQAWRRGAQPAVADFLGDVEEPLRSKLFEELLISDLEFRTRDETTIDTGKYHSAFPDRAEQIKQVLQRHAEEVKRRSAGSQNATSAVSDASGSTLGDEPLVNRCGSYQLLHEVARGGMGVVFKAYDTKLQRTVAVKMILDRNLASKEAVKRFHAEAEMTAGLDHPGIVPVYDVGVHEGHHYYAMGFVEGRTLSEEMRDHQFSQEEAVRLIMELADAVAYAHDRGVVHRDLKPGNILIAEDGQPKITDFGLAKRTDRPSELTMAGQVLGTPGYMAPEQAAGDIAQSGPPADIYALGAILYHLLTGHPPFRTALDALVCVLEQDPVPPRTLNRRVPRDLNVICMKCLSKDAGERYQSARDLEADLQSYLEGDLIQARPASMRRRMLRWARHRPRLAAVLATMAAFYLYHLVCLMLGNEGSQGAFHWYATGTIALACLYAWFYQTLWLRPSAKQSILYYWVATDIIVFTAFLLLAAQGAHSPLIVLYLCMVASAALSFDRHMVWLVTGTSVLSYAIVVLATGQFYPEPELPFTETVPMGIGMVAIGLIQYFVLRCARLQMNTAGRCRTQPATEKQDPTAGQDLVHPTR